MSKLFFRLSFIFLFVAFANASNSISTLEECKSSSQELLGVKPLCIDGEEIIRKNLLNTYGANEVEYRTKSGKYQNIKSLVVNDTTLWQITSKEGLTFTYAKKKPKVGGVIIKTYTGNGSTQHITTGVGSIDFTQANNGTGYWHDRTSGDGTVKDDAGNIVESGSIVLPVNKYISKVHIKSRNQAYANQMYDGLRGINKYIVTDQTLVENSTLTGLTSFDNSGFDLSTLTGINNSNVTYVAYQTIYTHLKWGLTNQGKRYIEAYNPNSGEGMIYYIGSGNAGHQIPHSLNRKLDFVSIKNLSSSSNWESKANWFAENDSFSLNLNIAVTTASSNAVQLTSDKYMNISLSGNDVGTSNNEYISYYKVKSKDWTIVQYTGTGASGNFVETKDINGVDRKPARIIIKRIDGTGGWVVFDKKRNDISSSYDGTLYLNSSEAESTPTDYISFENNGFVINEGAASHLNVSGAKHISLVDFEPLTDTNPKDYKLFNISDSSSSNIDFSYKNSDITFEYENKTANKKELYLSQITIVTQDGTKYYSVDYDSSLTASFSPELSPKTISNVLKKRFIYDENSQLIRKSVSGTNIEPIVTKYEYSTDSGNSVIKTVNALGHMTIDKYDTNNNLISSSDANGLTTTWQYDENNRLVNETKPNGVVTTYEYSTTGLVNGASSKIVINKTGKPTLTKYLDDKNRVIQTQTISFTGRTIVEDIIYDEQGRVEKHSLPYFKGEKVYFINFEYDEQNRVSSMDKPGQNESRLITTYVYNDGKVTVKYPDGNEQIINIDGTSSNITYEYDMLGDLIKTTDSKGMIVNFSYDALNRLVKKEITFENNPANVDTTYLVYDRADMGIGKLAYIKSEEYKKEYYYDELSRVNIQKVLIGNKVFTTQYTYTLDDKIETTITPDGFKIINEYNDLGFLEAVKSPKLASVELSDSDIKDLILENLSNEYEIYQKYYELKTQTNFYALKKVVYENLAAQYGSVDTQIQAQLSSVATLLGDTIVLLNKELAIYETILSNYKKIRQNHLLPKLTQKNDENNFKWLSETFKTKSQNYVSLATTYVDKASSYLEEVISNPAILNDPLNIHRDLITYYKDQSNEIVSLANSYNTISTTYNQRYEELKFGNGTMQDSAYLGMFDDTDFKYFYKVVDMDAFGRVTNEIFGNGLVTKKEYDPSSGNLIRIVTGYYGNNDIKDVKYTYDIYNNLVTQYDVKNNFTKNYAYDTSNRLISASSVGASFYSNISYSYVDPASSIYSYDAASNSFENTQTSMSIALDNPNLVKKDDTQISTLYSQDNKSYKKIITKNDEVTNTIYKVGNRFKYEVKNEDIKYKNLIYANGKLIAIHTEDDVGDFIIPNNYYLHKDMFNSIDIISNELAVVEDRYSYSPFGQRSDESWTQDYQYIQDQITNIGYKGFEHNELGYIDVAGYFFDPARGKTLTNKSIDSLTADTKEFFIYTNPTKYTDTDLSNWYDGVTKQFFLNINSNPLFDTEVEKEIHSIGSLSNVYIGYDEPSNTDEVWYQPNSEGGLDIKVYDNGSWQSVGSTGSISSTGSVTVSSLDKLNDLPCFYKDKGYVTIGGGKSEAYTCSVEQTWQLGGEFIGTYSTNDLVSTYTSALDNSRITVLLSVEGVSKTLTFKKVGDVWLSLDGTVQITYKDRASFTNVTSGTRYYTLVNDCTASTCNGIEANGYYANEKENDLYYFNYATNGNRKNNLIDANIRATITAMYESTDLASLVDSQTYIKKSDNKGRTIYQKAIDSSFVTKAGDTIPVFLIESGVVNLPDFKDASTVSFSENAIVVDSYKQITDWLDSPNEAQLSFNSKKYYHIKDATYDFWTDNTADDGQSSATQIFSSYGRSKVKTITHNGVKVYTRQLCTDDTACAKDNSTEPRYTDDGITASIDANYKEWFYATAGTIVNNLLDGAVINIDTTTYNLNLASLSTSQYGGILPYTILNVNAPIYGTDGSTGSSGSSGALGHYLLNCHGSGIAYGGNGSTGGSASSAINFSGFSSYTVKINNNSTIKGGTGGTGGRGGNAASNGKLCENSAKGGCGGSGGSGASWSKNISGVNIIIVGNNPINGSNGTTGSSGASVSYGGACN